MTKFAKVYALKTFVKARVVRFIYKWVVTHFIIPLEPIFDQGHNSQAEW
jgi:hypothetical protein